MPEIPEESNKLRKKLVNIIYNATEDELCFYDRLIMFATDEAAEIKKNLMLKRVY